MEQKTIEHCSDINCPECNKVAYEAGRQVGIKEGRQSVIKELLEKIETVRRTPFKRKTYQEKLEALNKPRKGKFALKRGSMVCPIPLKMREQMSNDPFYTRCAITGGNTGIQFHHNFYYEGKRKNVYWGIIPLTEWVHRNITQFQEKVDWIMLNRASDEELKEYSKAVDYIKERKRLNKIYGNYHIKR